MGGIRVYVGGLSYRANEKDIDKFFKDFRGVGNIVLKNGFAFVEFDDDREGEDAIYEMNGKELLGNRVTVEKAKGTPRNSRFSQSDGGRWGGGGGGGGGQPRNARFQPQRRFGQPSRTKHRIIVTNLSSQVSWQDLKDFMRKGGDVTFADAHRHQKNEGVTDFSSRADMKNALRKLDGKELCGRKIRLYESDGDQSGRPRHSRSASRSRSRSRSPISRSRSPRSPSRSRSRSRSRSSRSRSHTPKRGKRNDATPSKSRSPTPAPPEERGSPSPRD